MAEGKPQVWGCPWLWSGIFFFFVHRPELQGAQAVLSAQHFYRKVVKILTYPPGIFFWGWERSHRITSCEDSILPWVLSDWTVARSMNWVRRSGQPQKQNWIGRESRILFQRDLMESVEFLMLTDVKMFFVALPKSLPAHLSNQPWKHHWSKLKSCPKSICTCNFYYSLFKLSRFVFGLLEKTDPSSIIFLWVSPKS